MQLLLMPSCDCTLTPSKLYHPLHISWPPKAVLKAKLANPRTWFAQLPGIFVSRRCFSYCNESIQVLDDKSDNRVPDIRRALSKSGYA
ncbi:hypothetical protein M378DRAFT_521158 [Amanita muscaria Koide BX008]|uniref:Uncharacterized protein n=1 Tax=Amanita muscaria (strain Koide BX008) TaxID=946122 RepID=A0A0C2SQT1_AMAMK|nr:hypothetical protein M378DRAFT_521158 [Amanita muscaria Koide BX008]